MKISWNISIPLFTKKKKKMLNLRKRKKLLMNDTILLLLLLFVFTWTIRVIKNNNKKINFQ